MAKCRSCGAPIIWIKTQGGKSMPCDPDLTMYWQKPGAAGKIVTPNGEVISCTFTGDMRHATGLGPFPTFPLARTLTSIGNAKHKN